MSAKSALKRRRGLSTQFMNALKHDLLEPLLRCVHNDHVLDCQIRENYINIYYRGGSLLKIDESSLGYRTTFNRNYLTEQTTKVRDLPEILETSEDVQIWLDMMPHLKHEMDLYFGKGPKNEREFQQLVVRENNYSIIANSTDYFIIDIEYDTRKGDSSQKGARIDLIAVRWDLDRSSRKLHGNFVPGLSFFEIKYYDSSLGRTAGILAHFRDLQEFLSDDKNTERVKHEMLEVLQQKRELGLITGLEGNNNVLEYFKDEVDVIFLIANHDPAKSELKEIISEIQKAVEQKRFCFKIRFCTSNFMGYGLYKQNIYSVSEFKERFEKQIFDSKDTS